MEEYHSLLEYVPNNKKAIQLKYVKDEYLYEILCNFIKNKSSCNDSQLHRQHSC